MKGGAAASEKPRHFWGCINNFYLFIFFLRCICWCVCLHGNLFILRSPDGCTQGLTWELMWSAGQMRQASLCAARIVSRTSWLSSLTAGALWLRLCLCVHEFQVSPTVSGENSSCRQISGRNLKHFFSTTFFFFFRPHFDSFYGEAARMYGVIVTRPRQHILLYQLNRLHWLDDQPGRHYASAVCCLCVYTMIQQWAQMCLTINGSRSQSHSADYNARVF